jgi:UDP:flavonoid glycosyltransferase YjiC (YdhE family)
MGTPVLGIASNLDQLLNMHFVTAAGAGLLLRADQTSRESVNRAVSLMLSEDSFARQARQIASWFQGYSYRERFDAIVQAALREGGTGQV